jgi:hypothetical protein
MYIILPVKDLDRGINPHLCLQQLLPIYARKAAIFPEIRLEGQ